jgi:hypothetical protein
MREIWSFKKPYTCIFKFLGHYYFVENLKSVFFFYCSRQWQWQWLAMSSLTLNMGKNHVAN